jgi:hypothetical protein
VARHISFRGAVGVQQADRLLVGVGELGVAESRQQRACGDRVDQRLITAGERVAVAHGRISPGVGLGRERVASGSIHTVKALVDADALPGRSFLDLRLEQQEACAARGFRVPLWLMTSHATDEAIRRELGARLRGDDLATFTQDASLRLTPEGGLFRDGAGRAQPYATGHGICPTRSGAAGCWSGSSSAAAERS